MKYITLVELRQLPYDERMSLVNFIGGRCTTVDHISSRKIGYTPKSMYTIKGCVRAIQQRIIAANNKNSKWIRYIPLWEKHIQVLEDLKSVKSKYHD